VTMKPPPCRRRGATAPSSTGTSTA
jgi:hypothetical protein